MPAERGPLCLGGETSARVRKVLNIRQSQMETFFLKKSKRLMEIEEELPPPAPTRTDIIYRHVLTSYTASSPHLRFREHGVDTLTTILQMGNGGSFPQ